MTPHLALAQAVLGNSKLRLVTRERLSSSSHTGQDLGLRQTMLARHLVNKRHQITVEAVDLLLSDKAEDVHLAVLAVVQLPAVASEVDGSNGASRSGNRASATEGTNPDHDFVLWVAIDLGRGEEVVGDVCDEIAARVRPLPD